MMEFLHRRTFRFRLCRGPARGPLGWAEALSPRVGRVGFPSFWFLLKVVGLGGLDLSPI